MVPSAVSSSRVQLNYWNPLHFLRCSCRRVERPSETGGRQAGTRPPPSSRLRGQAAAREVLVIPSHWAEGRSRRADINHICHHFPAAWKRHAEHRKSAFNICIIDRKLVHSNSTFCNKGCLQRDGRRPPEKHQGEAWMMIINSWINLLPYPVERYMFIWKMCLYTLPPKRQHFQNAKTQLRFDVQMLFPLKTKSEMVTFPYTNLLKPVCINLQQQYLKEKALLNFIASIQVQEDQDRDEKGGKEISNVLFSIFFLFQ